MMMMRSFKKSGTQTHTCACPLARADTPSAVHGASR